MYFPYFFFSYFVFLLFFKQIELLLISLHLLVLLLLLIIKHLYLIFNFNVQNVKHFKESWDLPINYSFTLVIIYLLK